MEKLLDRIKGVVESLREGFSSINVASLRSRLPLLVFLTIQGGCSHLGISRTDTDRVILRSWIENQTNPVEHDITLTDVSGRINALVQQFQRCTAVTMVQRGTRTRTERSTRGIWLDYFGGTLFGSVGSFMMWGGWSGVWFDDWRSHVLGGAGAGAAGGGLGLLANAIAYTALGSDRVTVRPEEPQPEERNTAVCKEKTPASDVAVTLRYGDHAVPLGKTDVQGHLQINLRRVLDKQIIMRILTAALSEKQSIRIQSEGTEQRLGFSALLHGAELQVYIAWLTHDKARFALAERFLQEHPDSVVAPILQREMLRAHEDTIASPSDLKQGYAADQEDLRVKVQTLMSTFECSEPRSRGEYPLITALRCASMFTDHLLSIAQEALRTARSKPHAHYNLALAYWLRAETLRQQMHLSGNLRDALTNKALAVAHFQAALELGLSPETPWQNAWTALACRPLLRIFKMHPLAEAGREQYQNTVCSLSFAQRGRAGRVFSELQEEFETNVKALLLITEFGDFVKERFREFLKAAETMPDTDVRDTLSPSPNDSASTQADKVLACRMKCEKGFQECDGCRRTGRGENVGWKYDLCNSDDANLPCEQRLTKCVRRCR